MRSLSVLALLIVTPLPAQFEDAVAVGSNGDLYAVDSSRGVLRFITNVGVSGCEGLASDGRCRLWTTERVGGTGAAQDYVGALGTWPMTYTRGFATPGQLVDLAWNGTDALYGVRVAATGAPYFCQVDVRTGAVATVGAGLSSGDVRALAVFDGKVFAWDRTDGLIEIDPSAGNSTDVDPAVGTGVAGATGIEALYVRADGALIGAGDALYVIDPATGRITQRIALPAGTQLRGANAELGLIQSYGAGCASAHGTTTLQANGATARGLPVTTVSGSHDPSMPGFLLIGLSRLAYAGFPLPFALNVLGAPSCHLYTSADVVVAATTSPGTGPAQLQIALTLPFTFGCTPLYFQHLVLQRNGGIATTNGVEFRPMR